MITEIKPASSFIALQAEQFVRSVSSTMLFNHVMRCYWFSELFAQRDGSAVDQELLFLSAALHDLGLTDYVSGSNRFEIEGANAARLFLLGRGVADDRAWRVWDNIALHQWDINLYRDDTSRLLQKGIYFDVRGDADSGLDSNGVREILRRFPRMGFKNGFYSLLEKEIATKQPYKHSYGLCTCLAHHQSWITMPDPKRVIDGAPFAD
ncbi:metal-dependent phosphohydrolase [Acidipila sp. EB88]|uniref:metal-dependent phosphohydrolase n=1 Tax=Acidipila sp. EB88 TaxID=2305226 RepID=UPI000F5EDA7F|nr:metal-dependent phosphohydrolase [Acidipila sp. EB88]RRA49258.1 metal-dependent phosphohydrolase [Acidipila sp. EB88]